LHKRFYTTLFQCLECFEITFEFNPLRSRNQFLDSNIACKEKRDVRKEGRSRRTCLKLIRMENELVLDKGDASIYFKKFQ
jgi:hypothetical protein